jgi:hypothetical protein
MLVDQDGDVNPNVMFVLGILVGVGLSTAAHTFWMISGPPPDTVPTPAAIVDNAARATADEALTTESLTTADEEGEAPGEE